MGRRVLCPNKGRTVGSSGGGVGSSWQLFCKEAARRYSLSMQNYSPPRLPRKTTDGHLSHLFCPSYSVVLGAHGVWISVCPATEDFPALEPSLRLRQIRSGAVHQLFQRSAQFRRLLGLSSHEAWLCSPTMRAEVWSTAISLRGQRMVRLAVKKMSRR